MESSPDLFGRAELGHLPKDILGHGAEEGDHHQLLLLVPAEKRRVGHLLGRITGTLRDGVWRCRLGAGDISEQAVRGESRDNLGLPQEKVVPCETQGDEVSDRGDLLGAADELEGVVMVPAVASTVARVELPGMVEGRWDLGAMYTKLERIVCRAIPRGAGHVFIRAMT